MKGWAKRNKAKYVRLVALVAVGAPEQEVPSPALLPPIPDKKVSDYNCFFLGRCCSLGGSDDVVGSDREFCPGKNAAPHHDP